MKNYYKLLGLSRDASRQEINAAFKKLSLQFHPDKNGGYSDIFKEINEARQVLLDELKREEYDSNLKGYYFSKEFILTRNQFKTKKQFREKRPQLRFDIKEWLKKNSTALKWIGTVAGLAVALLFVIIAVDNLVDAMSEKPTKQPIVQLKKIPPNSAPPKTEIAENGPEKLPAVLTHSPKPKTTEPATVTEKRTISVVKQAQAKPVEAKKEVGYTRLSGRKALRAAAKIADKPVKNNGSLPSPLTERQVVAQEKEYLKMQLGNTEMSNIFRELSAKKLENNNKINCAKIIASAGSNVSNPFAVANYLKDKGFIISGRETTKEKVEGIRIISKGECFVVTIGNL